MSAPFAHGLPFLAPLELRGSAFNEGLYALFRIFTRKQASLRVAEGGS